MFGFRGLSGQSVLLLIFYHVTRGHCERLQVYLRSYAPNEAGFVEHYHSFLNIPLMASVKVYDSMACVLHCLRNAECKSVNFAVDPDDEGHRCDLLPSDKYYFRYKFQQNFSYHHYSLVVSRIIRSPVSAI